MIDMDDLDSARTPEGLYVRPKRPFTMEQMERLKSELEDTLGCLGIEITVLEYGTRMPVPSMEPLSMPTPPPTRRIREGVEATCPKCGSSMMRRKWLLFGKRPGCIQPRCGNYGGKHALPLISEEDAERFKNEFRAQYSAKTRAQMATESARCVQAAVHRGVS